MQLVCKNSKLAEIAKFEFEVFADLRSFENLSLNAFIFLNHD